MPRSHIEHATPCKHIQDLFSKNHYLQIPETKHAKRRQHEVGESSQFVI